MAFDIAVDRKVTRKRSGHAETMLEAVEFRVDVTREQDAVRVSPVGELDLATIDALREHIDEAMGAGGRVVLDLRETTFLDSTAMHLAVETDARAAQTRIAFAIIPGPPAVQRAFEAAGLSQRLPFVDVPRG